LYFSETSDKYNYFFDEFGNYQEVLSEDFDEDEGENLTNSKIRAKLNLPRQGQRAKLKGEKL
ncbi:MAG: hypothetical protein FWG65_02950, partial [Turicibacter sp.]|nr:hypothetical protein [Turicibacter sp.]